MRPLLTLIFFFIQKCYSYDVERVSALSWPLTWGESEVQLSMEFNAKSRKVDFTFLLEFATQIVLLWHLRLTSTLSSASQHPVTLSKTHLSARALKQVRTLQAVTSSSPCLLHLLDKALKLVHHPQALTSSWALNLIPPPLKIGTTEPVIQLLTSVVCVTLYHHQVPSCFEVKFVNGNSFCVWGSNLPYGTTNYHCWLTLLCAGNEQSIWKYHRP